MPKPFPQIESKLSTELLPNSESIWQDIAEKVYQKLEEISKAMTKPFSEERIKEMLIHEEAFVKKIWEQVITNIESGQNQLTILFDIDETIGARYFSDPNKPQCQTIIRPSFEPLVQRLRDLPVDLKIGLITTRRTEVINQQLNDPEHLQAIAALLNPEYLFTTTQLPIDQQNLAQQGEKQQVVKQAKKAKIVTKKIDEALQSLPETATNEERERHPQQCLFPADLAKILLLRNLLDSQSQNYESLFNNRTVLVVDDFIYPDYLNPEKVQGITLNNLKPNNYGIFKI